MDWSWSQPGLISRSTRVRIPPPPNKINGKNAVTTHKARRYGTIGTNKECTCKYELFRIYKFGILPYKLVVMDGSKMAGPLLNSYRDAWDTYYNR